MIETFEHDDDHFDEDEEGIVDISLSSVGICSSDARIISLLVIIE